MMEFTLARVTMCVCGVMIIAIIAGPVFGIYDHKAEQGYDDLCNSIAETIDSFYYGKADKLIIDMSSHLPAGVEMRISGYTISLITESSEHTSIISCYINNDVTLGESDIGIFEKKDGSISLMVV